MSRGLFRNIPFFFLAFWRGTFDRGALEQHRAPAGARGRGSQGRAARPARRGSLDGPGVLWRQPQLPPDPPGAPWPPVLFQAPKRRGRHSSDITIAQ